MVTETSADEPLHEAANVGPTTAFQGALKAAEDAALRSGNSGAGSVGRASALAHVLRGSDG